MAIVDVVKKVALRVIGRQPDSAFSPSTDRQTVDEIVDLANDVAQDISASHDWQALTKIATINGDGSTTKFPLPSDYSRMSLGSSLIDPSTWFWGYVNIPTVTEWLMEDSYGFRRITPGAWIILENQFNFVPAPSSQAKYPYISKNIVRAGSTAKPAFTTDNDTFILDERVLTLGTIWRWKEQKGLEYGEDMQTYEIALSQAQARDKGARVLRSGRPYVGANTHLAWPWPLGGV